MTYSITLLRNFLVLGCLLFSTTSVADTDPTKLPLFSIEKLEYKGAFRIPSDTYGESSANWASGVITYNPRNHSLFLVGHNHHQAIAEFKIPQIINSKKIEELKTATVIQPFVKILSRLESNPDKLDRITGMHFDHGRLIINAIKYYDAAAKAKDTTIVILNASQLSEIESLQLYQMEGAAQAAGWISPLPPIWREKLDGDLVTGNSSGWPINARLSMGPSAFIGKIRDFIHADIRNGTIPLNKKQFFDLNYPLAEDSRNKQGNNDLHTEVSHAIYGFVIPGTRTYFVIGPSGGHKSGVIYKYARADGTLCPGDCSIDPSDYANYVWLWDVNDWDKVKHGKIRPTSIRPYYYGAFTIPIQRSVSDNRLIGGTFDAKNNNIYLTIDRNDNLAGLYRNPPVIAVFGIKK